MKKPITYKRVLIFFFMMCSLTIEPAGAQISIPQMTAYGYQLKHAYSQNFNSLPATGDWINGSTLPGWYATPLRGIMPSGIAANDGSSRTIGLYSFGSTDNPDRALGGHGANGWGGYYYAVRFKNNSGATLKHIKINYSIEQWFWNRQTTVPFSASYAIAPTITDPGSTLAWTHIPSSQMTIGNQPYSGNNLVTDGNAANNKWTVSETLLNVNLAPNQEIMIRWEQHDASGITGSGQNFPSVALDDVQIEFIQNDVFYAVSKVLSNQSSWSVDGTSSGRTPKNFTDIDQTFVVAAGGHYKLSRDLTISGLNSKLILGEETAIATLTIPNKYRLKALIDIANGSTLIVNHATRAPVFGSLAPNSNVIYNTDSTDAPVQGNFGNLHITGSREKVIDMPVQVRGKLRLAGTGVKLRNATITLENGAAIEHIGEAAFIKLGPQGTVKQYLQSGSTRFLPVGSERSYTPVGITLPAGKAARYVSVTIEDGVYAHYDASRKGLGEPLQGGLVNKVWMIDQEGATSPDAEVAFYWNPEDELPDFDRTMSEMAYYNGTVWESAGGIVATMAGARAAAALPTNYVTLANARGGMYGVWQPPRNPLPVELTAFTARYKDGITTLKWTTASERGSDYFSVEVSLDGKHFSEVGQVKAAGFSSVVNNYTFTHLPTTDGIVYYRLVEYAEDGEKSFSGTVSVNAKEDGPAKIVAYPNPGHGKLYLTSATITGETNLVVRNMNGKTMLTKTIVLSPAEPVEVDLQHLSEGIYIVQLQSSAGWQTIRWIHLPR
ncbi:T9SS type A sorting domain-containing protein [Pontibacter pudoricolor]|uniref:T9SS type A sorting domain-containing protein n=1 Tax=Pontibacter pudoricolor TaxID=2694930 RepID=UPI001390B3BD|nr:T9SS type A sorting domain-containing protein [Pontibacter pudoricolor]